MMSKLGSKDLDREKLLTSMSVAGGGTGKPEKQKWLNLDSRKSSIAKDEEKRAKKAAKANAKAPPGPAKKELINFKQSDKNLVPLFLEKCVQFIELEGLDSEGIYRVPGNRAHVDLLYQKFDEGESLESQIPIF
jgi:RhoGAP domain